MLSVVFQNSHFIAFFDIAVFKNSDEYSFARHDAVSGFSADLAVIMTFLPDLSDFTYGCPDFQEGSDRKFIKTNAFSQYVFGKSTGF